MSQKATYFNSADDVLHTFNPIARFLSKFLPKDWFVIKCQSCNKIPTEVLEGKCRDCFKKQ